MGRDKRNEKRGGRFVMLPHRIMDSPAWIGLSGSAKSVHLVLIRRFDGRNNGQIFIPTREAGDALGLGRNAVARALRELEEAGFLVEMVGSHLGLEGKGRASKWRLTHLPAGDQTPTFDFEKKQNPGTKTVQPLHQNGAKGTVHQKAKMAEVAPKQCQGSAPNLHQKGANLIYSHRQGPKVVASHVGLVRQSKGAFGKVIDASRVFKTKTARPGEALNTTSPKKMYVGNGAQHLPSRADLSQQSPDTSTCTSLGRLGAKAPSQARAT